MEGHSHSGTTLNARNFSSSSVGRLTIDVKGLAAIETPQDWKPDKILGLISDAATDPSSSRTLQPSGRFLVKGTREGVDISVVLEPPGPKGGRIVTGYPTNLPRNP